MNVDEVSRLADTDPVEFVAYILQGEWPFDPVGQLLGALCMALRIERWGHDINDLRREWHGWKQLREPSDWLRYLAARVLDGRLLNLMYCMSKDDVERVLPGLGYTPGEADFIWPPEKDAVFGLRLYCTAEGWKGKANG